MLDNVVEEKIECPAHLCKFLLEDDIVMLKLGVSDAQDKYKKLITGSYVQVWHLILFPRNCMNYSVNFQVLNFNSRIVSWNGVQAQGAQEMWLNWNKVQLNGFQWLAHVLTAFASNAVIPGMDQLNASGSRSGTKSVPMILKPLIGSRSIQR